MAHWNGRFRRVNGRSFDLDIRVQVEKIILPSPEATGLEVDKLDKEAVKVYQYLPGYGINKHGRNDGC